MKNRNRAGRAEALPDEPDLQTSAMARVEPIRIGPERAPALSIDQLRGASCIADPEPGVEAHFDWSRFLRTLSYLEQRVFLAHWREGTPRYRLAEQLRITPRAAGEAYAAIVLKLRGPFAVSSLSLERASNSRSIVYRDRATWMMGTIDQSFCEIMHQENFISLISQRDPAKIEKRRRFCPRTVGSKMKTILTDLTKSLASEKSKRDRLAERVHQAGLAVNAAEVELGTLQRSVSEEQVIAALAEQPVACIDARKLAAAEGKLRGAESIFDAQKIALDRQAAVVVRIEDEIYAGRHEAFVTELEPSKVKVMALMKQFCEAAAELDAIAGKHGVGPEALGRALFGYRHGDFSGHMEDVLRGGLINHAITLRLNLAREFAKAV